MVRWNFLISFTVNWFILFNVGLLAFTESQKCSKPTVKSFILGSDNICCASHNQNALLRQRMSITNKTPNGLSLRSFINQCLLEPWKCIVFHIKKVSSFPQSHFRTESLTLLDIQGCCWVASSWAGLRLVSSMPFEFPFHLPVLFYNDYFS